MQNAIANDYAKQSHRSTCFGLNEIPPTMLNQTRSAIKTIPILVQTSPS